MSLTGLAEEISCSGRGRCQTPVVVTPHYLSLRSEFIVQLACELVRNPSIPRGVRFDWLCDSIYWRKRLAHFRANRVMAKFNRHPELRDRASLVVAGAIGRCQHVDDTLVIGIADEKQELPRWARTIELVGLVRHGNFQLT